MVEVKLTVLDTLGKDSTSEAPVGLPTLGY